MPFWVPLNSMGKKYLPKDRPYTELEAMFSLQCDYYQEKTVTVSGYASLWRWSRKKVNSFFKKAGIFIEYPVQGKRNQRGHIRVHKRDIKGTNEEHIFSFTNSKLSTSGDIRGANEGHKGGIKGSTTIKSKEIKVRDNKEQTSGFADFLDFFNGQLKTKYRGDSKTKRQFSARIKEGFLLDDFEKAIQAAKNNSFLMGKNDQGKRFLTPEYITRPDKLDEYLNQKNGQEQQPFGHVYPPSADEVMKQFSERRDQ